MASLHRPMRNDAIFLLRLIAATLIARQNQVLMAEVVLVRTDRDFYRDKIPPGTPLHFTDEWRLRYARAGAAVAALAGWKRVGHLVTAAKGKTIQGWERLRKAGKLGVQRAGRGRPNCNAFAERWVKTVKTELIRRCRFLDYNGLVFALREYAEHFNTERPHQAKGNRPLTGNPGPQVAAQKIIAGFKPGQIRCVTRCGGAIKHYYRVAA